MSETRDESEIAVDVLSAHAQHLRDLAAVEGNPLMALTLQDAARRADRAASGYAKAVPPRLPDEPPDGTVLAGTDGQVWQRRDDEPGGDENWHWWRAGWSDPFTWDHAVQRGADAGRRLVKLPDWSDGEAMGKLADAAGYTHRPNLSIVRAVVRALAERGNRDG